jgi:hypothetical protein
MLNKVYEPEDDACVAVKYGLRWRIAKNSPRLLITAQTQITRSTDISKRPLYSTK